MITHFHSSLFPEAQLAAAAAAAAGAGGPHGLPPSHPLLEAARQSDLMYREMLTRPPYSTDPVLAQQVWCSSVGLKAVFD